MRIRHLPIIAAILSASLATSPVPCASLLADALHEVPSPAASGGKVSPRGLAKLAAPALRDGLRRFRCVLPGGIEPPAPPDADPRPPRRDDSPGRSDSRRALVVASAPSIHPRC